MLRAAVGRWKRGGCHPAQQLSGPWTKACFPFPVPKLPPPGAKCGAHWCQPSFHLDIRFRWQRSSLESSFVCQCRLKNKLNSWRLRVAFESTASGPSSSRVSTAAWQPLWIVCPQRARFSSRSRKHTQRMLKLQHSLPEHGQSKRSKADRQPMWRDVPSKRRAPATASATVPSALKAEFREPVPVYDWRLRHSTSVVQ